MKAIKSRMLVTIGGLSSLALILLMPIHVWGGKGSAGGGTPALPPPVTGAEICGNPSAYPQDGDYDQDGFSNGEECAGLTSNGITSYLTIYGYGQSGTQPRSAYLDPSTKDVFLWIDPAVSNSNIPSNPSSIYESGLGATVHPIGPENVGSPTPGDVFSLYRAITSSGGAPKQKAVKITEDTDPSLYDGGGAPLELGISNYGTPNGPDETIVFSERIRLTVQGKCTGVATCKDVGGTSGDAAVAELYTKHVIAHELGHLSKLTRTVDVSGEHHYPAESFSVMEKSIAAKKTSTRNGGTFTFYISTIYADPDKADAATTGY